MLLLMPLTHLCANITLQRSLGSYVTRFTSARRCQALEQHFCDSSTGMLSSRLNVKLANALNMSLKHVFHQYFGFVSLYLCT
jgi:hypothetical protein